jgi:hypothetical protein
MGAAMCRCEREGVSKWSACGCFCWRLWMCIGSGVVVLINDRLWMCIGSGVVVLINDKHVLIDIAATATLRTRRHANIIEVQRVFLNHLNHEVCLLFDYSEYDLQAMIVHHRDKLKGDRTFVPNESMLKSIMHQLLKGIHYLCEHLPPPSFDAYGSRTSPPTLLHLSRIAHCLPCLVSATVACLNSTIAVSYRSLPLNAQPLELDPAP